MKARYSATPLLAACLLAASCSDIEPADRFIELPPIEAKRVVLLEEFTGQNCPNCPNAHKVIESLHHDYPNNLITVSIHAGFQSIPVDDGGLATELGNQYAASFGVDKYPSGVIDRTSGVLTSDQWASAIRDAIQKPSHYEITLTAQLTDQNTIDIATSILTDEVGTASVQLWVVESNIYDYQIMPNNSIDYEYCHNHVFRAAVNGPQGEKVTTDYGKELTLTNSIAVDPEWNPQNLSIVGFIYTDKGVQQAASTQVTSIQ